MNKYTSHNTRSVKTCPCPNLNVPVIYLTGWYHTRQITLTPHERRLKSPATPVFIQPLVMSNNKENIRTHDRSFVEEGTWIQFAANENKHVTWYSWYFQNDQAREIWTSSTLLDSLSLCHILYTYEYELSYTRIVIYQDVVYKNRRFYDLIQITKLCICIHGIRKFKKHPDVSGKVHAFIRVNYEIIILWGLVTNCLFSNITEIEFDFIISVIKWPLVSTTYIKMCTTIW